jgi:signal transduction histidine kinase
VGLEYTSSTVKLTVADNGQGFRPEEKPRLTDGSKGGLGLIGMRERARLVAGKFNVKSAPGKGTTVSIKVPVPAKSTERTIV